jgi:hypothetical protein
METPLTGGCACGAIRYVCTAAPLLALKCHCRACQRASGTAYAAILRVPAAAFTVTQGAPSFFTVAGDSGNRVSRGFCPACGSPLFSRLSGGLAEVVGIRVGSLDDPSQYQPSLEMFVASAQPWDCLSPTLPHFPGYPPGVGSKRS